MLRKCISFDWRANTHVSHFKLFVRPFFIIKMLIRMTNTAGVQKAEWESERDSEKKRRTREKIPINLCATKQTNKRKQQQKKPDEYNEPNEIQI